METTQVPESYHNWILKLERAQKFAVRMVRRLSDECGKPVTIRIEDDDPVRPSLTGLGFEIEFEGELNGTITLPVQESQWKPLLDQLSFALRWHMEKNKTPAEAAVK
jgi:hypothetical protein